MGKYIRKSKMASEIALMDISHSSLGVLTRAKTLALQRLMKSASPYPAVAAADGGDYLQLRSRRLVKPPFPLKKRQKEVPPQKQRSRLNPNPNDLKLNSIYQLRSRGLNEGCVENDTSDKEREVAKINGERSYKDGNMDLCVEASLGKNVLEAEGRERTTRESTPCSLVRYPDTNRAPGSTTRPTCSTNNNRRLRSSSRRDVPTTNEMDEFFTGPEEEQQRQFIEKYNFDPVNEKPLPGRYEWEKVKP